MALVLLRKAVLEPTVQMTLVGYNTAIFSFAHVGPCIMAVRLLDEMEGSYTNAATTSKLLLPPHVSKPNPDEGTWHCHGSM
eukprot:14261672-Ditylum_brightwellii.AAC.1